MALTQRRIKQPPKPGLSCDFVKKQETGAAFRAKSGGSSLLRPLEQVTPNYRLNLNRYFVLEITMRVASRSLVAELSLGRG